MGNNNVNNSNNNANNNLFANNNNDINNANRGNGANNNNNNNNANDNDANSFKVVSNHEEQYSIWPAHRDNALGWFDEGTAGSKEQCLSHIEAVWTDMRPLSLRRAMAVQTV